MGEKGFSNAGPDEDHRERRVPSYRPPRLDMVGQLPSRPGQTLSDEPSRSMGATLTNPSSNVVPREYRTAEGAGRTSGGDAPATESCRQGSASPGAPATATSTRPTPVTGLTIEIPGEAEPPVKLPAQSHNAAGPQRSPLRSPRSESSLPPRGALSPRGGPLSPRGGGLLSPRSAARPPPPPPPRGPWARFLGVVERAMDGILGSRSDLNMSALASGLLVEGNPFRTAFVFAAAAVTFGLNSLQVLLVHGGRDGGHPGRLARWAEDVLLAKRVLVGCAMAVLVLAVLSNMCQLTRRAAARFSPWVGTLAHLATVSNMALTPLAHWRPERYAHWVYVLAAAGTNAISYLALVATFPSTRPWRGAVLASTAGALGASQAYVGHRNVGRGALGPPEAGALAACLAAAYVTAAVFLDLLASARWDGDEQRGCRNSGDDESDHGGWRLSAHAASDDGDLAPAGALGGRMSMAVDKVRLVFQWARQESRWRRLSTAWRRVTSTWRRAAAAARRRARALRKALLPLDNTGALRAIYLSWWLLTGFLMVASIVAFGKATERADRGAFYSTDILMPLGAVASSMVSFGLSVRFARLLVSSRETVLGNIVPKDVAKALVHKVFDARQPQARRSDRADEARRQRILSAEEAPAPPKRATDAGNLRGGLDPAARRPPQPPGASRPLVSNAVLPWDADEGPSRPHLPQSLPERASLELQAPGAPWTGGDGDGYGYEEEEEEPVVEVIMPWANAEREAGAEDVEHYASELTYYKDHDDITMMFSDLVTFTAFANRVPPRTALLALHNIFEVLDRVVGHLKGYK